MFREVVGASLITSALEHEGGALVDLTLRALPTKIAISAIYREGDSPEAQSAKRFKASYDVGRSYSSSSSDPSWSSSSVSAAPSKPSIFLLEIDDTWLSDWKRRKGFGGSIASFATDFFSALIATSADAASRSGQAESRFHTPPFFELIGGVDYGKLRVTVTLDDRPDTVPLRADFELSPASSLDRTSLVELALAQSQGEWQVIFILKLCLIGSIY